METETQEVKLKKLCGKGKRCSSFDEDCAEVPNHLFCFLGNGNTGVADGYCPFIHTEN